MPKPKVLIVEDWDHIREAYAAALAEKADLIVAPTIVDAIRLYHENAENIALIIMDGMLPRSPHDREMDFSYGLVTSIRRRFTGPIIAASSDKDFRAELMSSGCSHEGKGHDREGTARLALQILGLEPQEA
jgi:CheY-like chemotaxis protein